MLKTTYKKRSILIALLISLVFTCNAFSQNARANAIKYKQHGDTYYNKQEYKSAVESYLKAIEEDDSYLETYWAMASTLSRMHEHKLSGGYFALYLQKVSEIKAADNTAVAYVFYLIGNEYRLAKEFKLSEESFDYAIQFPSKYIQDYEAVADIYSYRGNLNKAVEFQIKAINSSSSDDDSGRYISLSWYYSFLQRHKESVDAATKSISLKGGQAMAYTNRCRAYNDLKQYDKAITDCKKALTLQPDHGETQYYMANAFRGKGNPTEATRLNRLAIPNLAVELKQAADNELISLPDYCYILGNALFENKNFPEAVTAYEVGLEFKPNFPSLRFNLGMAYLKVKNKNGAMEQYRELSNIDSAKAKMLKQRIDQTK